MAKIIKFEVENFLSIKDKIILSMESDLKDENLIENLIEKEGVGSLAPLLSIYGNNATGKTNIIKAIAHLGFLIRTTPFMTVGQNILRTPFQLTKEKPTIFTIVFEKKQKRYAYHISFNDTHILTEALYSYPQKKQKKIFERTSEGSKTDVTFSRDHSSIFKNIKKKILTNKLCLGTLAEWVELDEIKDVIEFFKEDLVISVDENPVWLNDTINILKDNDEYRKIFLKILKKVNPSIKDFEAKFEKITLDSIPPQFPEELKLLLQKQDTFEAKVKIIYEQEGIIFDLKEESKGVKKFFEIGGHIIDVLFSGKILFYDELETSFHPVVSKMLISLFTNKEINVKGAQLIFTTHDINLLDLNLLRKDQILFTEKSNKTNHSTILTSLSQIKGVRKDENIRAKYLRGTYTEIEFLDSTLLINYCGDK